MSPRPRPHVLVLLASTLALLLSACTASAPTGQQSASPSAGEAAPSGGGAQGSVTLGLTYVPNVQFAPVYLAEDRGLYASTGTQVRVRHHGADEGLFTALVSGQEDLVLASGDEVLQARDSELDLVSVGAYYHSHPARVIVKADSAIKELSDLKGKRIGVPGEYGSNWYYLLAVLKSLDLDSSDVQVVSIGYTQQAALTQGQVDAVIGFVNNDLVQLERSGMTVRTLGPDQNTVPLVSASLVTTRSFAEAHPDLVRSVVSATRGGVEVALADPEAVLAATTTRDPSLTGAAAQSAAAVWEATAKLLVTADGAVSATQDLDTWKAMAVFFGTVPDMLHSGPDLKASVTNEYATE
ncbi:ABC transporter substrate-binding protein [Schaalia sp. 19OD2882]|uniref:ABC transporter substrate-binding protein n=1 Tax=Schaalia sp. 19OD2882 TaxID=2794089 RepID=UPI001C1EEC9D|nr:ABC transporter substrate-binding protein [Schaalia sp. 19OD2882]QWW18689.1 ABC transporter substrate-binding protein [Schaalia sp. 19OD2882]